jgi:hypothetical protein
MCNSPSVPPLYDPELRPRSKLTVGARARLIRPGDSDHEHEFVVEQRRHGESAELTEIAGRPVAIYIIAFTGRAGNMRAVPETWCEPVGGPDRDIDGVELDRLRAEVDADLVDSPPAAELKQSSSRRRGPTPGSVSHYGNADRALFPELENLMREMRLSRHAAARELAKQGKVVGGGTELSRARRLAGLHAREKPPS